MKRLFSMLRQDIILSYRNGFLLVTLITLAVIVLLYWTLPLMMGGKESPLLNIVLADNSTQGGLLQEPDGGEDYARAFFGSDRFSMTILENTAQAEEYLKGHPGTPAIIISGDAAVPGGLHYELLTTGTAEPGRDALALLALRHLREFRGDKPAAVPAGGEVEIETLDPGAAVVAPGENFIIVMLAMEVMILGYLFVSVMVFQEKQEGSIRAYRVSPGGLVSYVASKVMVFSLMSSAYGLLLLLFTMGWSFNYLVIAGLLLLACSFMTALGLGIASYFQNLSQWFAAGVTVLSINMLSIIPFELPGYRSAAISLLPGYRMMRGFNRLLFFPDDGTDIRRSFLYLGVYLVLALFFAAAAVRRNMMKESR